MTDKPSMQAADWASAAVNAVVGVFLGLAADGLAHLVTTAFWPLAVIIPVLFAGALLLDTQFSRLVDRFFPSGVGPARRPQAKRAHHFRGF